MTLLIAALLGALCPGEQATLESAASAFEAYYVLDEKAGGIAAAIRAEAAAAPPAPACRPADVFAPDLTGALRRISGDKHVFVEPSGPAEAGEADDAGWIEEWYAAAPSENYGIAAVEILDGNVGYLKLTSFYDLPETWARYGAAFTLLQGTQALVLDLRGNGGGSPEAELRIQWSFLEPGDTPPLVMDLGPEGLSDRDVPEIGWPRYGRGRPLYILTDAMTFSAAEAVAYGLQAAGRASIVGEPTGGGAHMVGEAIALQGGYRVYMPQSRPVSPHTLSNWEGSGVEPDLAVGGGAALQAALDELASRKAATTENSSPY